VNIVATDNMQLEGAVQRRLGVKGQGVFIQVNCSKKKCVDSMGNQESDILQMDATKRAESHIFPAD